MGLTRKLGFALRKGYLQIWQEHLEMPSISDKHPTKFRTFTVPYQLYLAKSDPIALITVATSILGGSGHEAECLERFSKSTRT